MKMKTRSGRRTPKLGQHFLNNPVVAKSLVEAAGVREGNVVVEIGPGTGALTKDLLAAGGHVLAIEKDPSLVIRLNKAFAREIQAGELTILEQDVRNFSPENHELAKGEYVLAANIPYYITGEIIRQFLTSPIQPRSIALLIQKEVADRIVARDGKESILSLSVKAYGTPRVIRKVSAGNFNPPPSVDSAIIAITDISRRAFEGLDEEKFFSVLKAGFASKRKVLRSNLARVFPHTEVIRACDTAGISTMARAEDVPLETWRRLASSL